MDIPRVDTDRVTAFVDMEQRLVRVTYRGALHPETTVAVYGWINEMARSMDVGNVRGAIYDFRLVTAFPMTNMTTVQKESHRLNFRLDMSHVPVALLVDKLYQEQMVRVSMRITPDEHRKRIVRSEEEALAFIDAWHRKRHAAEIPAETG